MLDPQGVFPDPGSPKVESGVPDYKRRWLRDLTVMNHLCMAGEKQSSPLLCCHIGISLLGDSVLWEPPKEMSVTESLLKLQTR